MSRAIQGTYNGKVLVVRVSAGFLDQPVLRIQRPDDVDTKLKERTDVPAATAKLIRAFFSSNVVTQCTLQYGSKLTFTIDSERLKKKGYKSYDLESHVEFFGQLYAEQTDSSIEIRQPATYSDAKRGRPRGRLSGLFSWLVDLLDKPTTAIDLLIFGDWD